MPKPQDSKANLALPAQTQMVLRAVPARRKSLSLVTRAAFRAWARAPAKQFFVVPNQKAADLHYKSALPASNLATSLCRLALNPSGTAAKLLSLPEEVK